MSFVKLDNLSAGYSKENVIENISFDFNEGELVGVLGLNGSGKSTLAKSICNILSHSGCVTIDDKVIENLDVRKTSKIISYIPQHSGLSIDISLFDVVMMGYNPVLKFFGKPSNEMEENAKYILDKLGLGSLADTNYMSLSDGQKQLTILARSLVGNSSLLVMDEPESALDYNVRHNIIKAVKEWINTGKRAGLIILHDVILALNSCDKLVLLKDKKCVAIIDLHVDSIDFIEEKLRLIYGDISLVKAKNKSGEDYLLMMI